MKIRILTTVSLIALSTAAFAQTAPATIGKPAWGEHKEQRMERFEEHRHSEEAKLDAWTKRLEERKMHIHEAEERLAREKIEIAQKEKELAEMRVRLNEHEQRSEERHAQIEQKMEQRREQYQQRVASNAPVTMTPAVTSGSAPSVSVTH